MTDKTKSAFTLAEVLITLVIIGVVAAMTIPTAIANYQKRQTVEKLKAAYSQLSQALRMASSEHGDLKNWGDEISNVDGGTAEKSRYFFETYLKPYMRIEKYCIPSSEECWTPPVSLSGRAMAGSLNNNTQDYYLSFVLSNGMSVYFWSSNNGTYIYVNINGLKKGVVGRDVFGFKLGSGESMLLGMGYDKDMDTLINDSTMGCSKDVQGQSAGRYCAALIQRSGWKIDDNYPW